MESLIETQTTIVNEDLIRTKHIPRSEIAIVEANEKYEAQRLVVNPVDTYFAFYTTSGCNLESPAFRNIIERYNRVNVYEVQSYFDRLEEKDLSVYQSWMKKFGKEEFNNNLRIASKIKHLKRNDKLKPKEYEKLILSATNLINEAGVMLEEADEKDLLVELATNIPTASRAFRMNSDKWVDILSYNARYSDAVIEEYLTGDSISTCDELDGLSVVYLKDPNTMTKNEFEEFVGIVEDLIETTHPGTQGIVLFQDKAINYWPWLGISYLMNHVILSEEAHARYNANGGYIIAICGLPKERRSQPDLHLFLKERDTLSSLFNGVVPQKAGIFRSYNIYNSETQAGCNIPKSTHRPPLPIYDDSDDDSTSKQTDESMPSFDGYSETDSD